MKKIGLFIILCAGFLKGMETGHFRLGELPTEAKSAVITALNTYDNLADVIEAIKAMSLTNKDLNKIINEMYGNQEGFKALVHILSDKFNEGPMGIIEQFKNTPAAKEYLRLVRSLNFAIDDNDVNQVIQLIEQKVDVNSAYIPLYYAATEEKNIIVKLLLNAGAKPNFIMSRGLTNSPSYFIGTILDYAQKEGASEEIIELLKKHGAKTLSELNK